MYRITFVKQVFLSCLFALYSLLNLTAAAKDYTIQTIPNVRLTDREDHVSNPDSILSEDHIKQINALLNELEDSLSIEVAVVAVKSIGDQDAREFATELFNYWGLGKKNKDNGLLIQLVTEPSQRSVVFETGYGIEAVLPDAICFRLQQTYMIPGMKAGDYSGGMLHGVSAVRDYLLASDYERAEMIGDSGKETSMDDSFLPFLFIFLAPMLLIIGIVIARLVPRRCPRCNKKGLIAVNHVILRRPTYYSSGLQEVTYRCKFCGYTEKRTQRISQLQRSGGGGFGRGGGFNGGHSGGGSWGGGRSGGGGSISRF